MNTAIDDRKMVTRSNRQPCDDPAFPEDRLHDGVFTVVLFKVATGRTFCQLGLAMQAIRGHRTVRHDRRQIQ
ncbi:MAG: hypothetical protein Q8K93_23015 [Reyranella sp.]|nr:hypothetical protein [Reyranella sp.]